MSMEVDEQLGDVFDVRRPGPVVGDLLAGKGCIADGQIVDELVGNVRDLLDGGGDQNIEVSLCFAQRFAYRVGDVLPVVAGLVGALGLLRR